MPLSPEQLIADVEDGLLIHGDGSWSIDMQRRNFQFGGQIGYLIKNGKIDSMVRDFAFQSNTVEFWNSCDGICSEEHAGVGGSYHCGKGQPGQVAPVSHGSAPARFRQVNTINTNTRI
jgi:TldD protein